MTTQLQQRPRVRASRKTTAGIMEQLDAWVASHGNGRYERSDWVPMDAFMIPDDAGIQQDRDEIQEFVDVLLKRQHCATALEVGLGYYGSTHFLWRLIFNRVITIEKSHERVRSFGTSMRRFYKRWVLDDRRSAFLIGMSYEPSTVQNAYQSASDGVDLLFIDGDHQYHSVLTDWLLYSPLVRPGGLVAFHDIGLTVKGQYGVPEFLRRLSSGALDGTRRTLRTIQRTKNLGIAFYEA
ncbi:MAG: class I SAM-dependent methyltransferase [Candidatus Omnitrophica bacterium]|nr:class I SAM-dependent methyltransferase [Candidatus Omnitrophota bacterium]